MLAHVRQSLERNAVQDRPHLGRGLAGEAVVHPPVEPVVAEGVRDEELQRSGEARLVKRGRPELEQQPAQAPVRLGEALAGVQRGLARVGSFSPAISVSMRRPAAATACAVSSWMSAATRRRVSSSTATSSASSLA